MNALKQKENGKKTAILSAKSMHAETLIRFLSNPANEWPTKEQMSLKVLGMQSKIYVNKTWSPAEFQTDIAAPALKLRRSRYAAQLSRVDQALFEQAEAGNIQAAKLIYQRFEGWKEGQEVELSTTGGMADNRIQISFVTVAEVREQEAEKRRLEGVS